MTRQLRPRPLFAITDLKLSALPLLVTFLVGMGVPQLGLPLRWLLGRIASPDQLAIYPWLSLYAGHTGQLLGALACIAVMRRFIPGYYGLRLPPRKSYIGAAIAWGIAFGVAMTLVDYAPKIAEHAAPKGFYPLTPVNVLGWLSFEALFVGFPEEILFRGLLVTYLMAKVRGRYASINIK